MERIIKTVKIKKKRETYPDTGFSSLERERNVRDNHKNQVKGEHGMQNFERQTRLPQFTIDDLNQREVAERRKNFAITRSKSFALPVNLLHAHNPSNLSYTSLSRKSSFSSLLSKNDSLYDRTHRAAMPSDVCLRREVQYNPRWDSKEILYQEQVAEVLEKWDTIDDEVWAKIIVHERNKRIAKAYAKTRIMSINGSKCGFDGFKVGLNGFENPMKDGEVEACKAAIGMGCKLKLTENGDILIKRVGRSNVFVQNMLAESAVSNDVLKLHFGLLEQDRAMKLFDIKKFKQNMNREMKRVHPDWNNIQSQAISSFSFVKNPDNVLECPIWVMIVNIVALEMVQTKKHQHRNYR